jgi:hypothetical protein
MDVEPLEPKSLDMPFLTLHQPVDPFKPAKAEYMACNLCKRPVGKNPPHDEPMIDDPDVIEARDRYLGLEVNLQRLLSTMRKMGFDIDPQVDVIGRLEQILEFMMRMLMTNTERLNLEAVILENRVDKYTRFLEEVKDKRMQEKINPLGAGRLLGPDGRPTQ